MHEKKVRGWEREEVVESVMDWAKVKQDWSRSAASLGNVSSEQLGCHTCDTSFEATHLRPSKHDRSSVDSADVSSRDPDWERALMGNDLPVVSQSSTGTNMRTHPLFLDGSVTRGADQNSEKERVEHLEAS